MDSGRVRAARPTAGGAPRPGLLRGGLQSLGLGRALPGELGLGAAEVAVGGGLPEDRAPQVEVLGTTVDESDLADTGAETTPLLLAAALLLGVGLLSVEAGRRLTPATARTR